MAEDKIITENESKPPKPKKDKKIDKNKTIGQVLDDLENDKFVCYYCDKIFSGLKFLQNHWKKHCDENGNMPCRQCERAFETRKKLRQHQLIADISGISNQFLLALTLHIYPSMHPSLLYTLYVVNFL